MSETSNWITIEQAAVMLGLSVRTVNRHIAAGKLQSRLQEGRREVLIEDTLADVNVGQAGAATNAVNSDPAVDYETVLALADNAADKAELAVSAYQTLARSADERISSTRRLSYVAWSLVGFMAVASMGAIGWTTSKLTRAAVETQHLKEQVNTTTLQADAAVGECDDLRRALAQAREQAARTEGQLAVYSESAKSQTSPTTRPTLAERIASIFEP
jgi:excisionase family DNA binding protein